MSWSTPLASRLAPKRTLVVFELADSPCICAQASGIHHIRQLVPHHPACSVLHLKVVGQKLLPLEGLVQGLLEVPGGGCGVSWWTTACVRRWGTAEGPSCIHLCLLQVFSVWTDSLEWIFYLLSLRSKLIKVQTCCQACMASLLWLAWLARHAALSLRLVWLD